MTSIYYYVVVLGVFRCVRKMMALFRASDVY